MSKNTPNITPITSNTDVLKNKALTVRLTRKKLNRNKMDKDLAVALHELKNVTDAGSLRVNKSLFPKEATDKYQKIITDAGKYFYRTTTPWDDKGWRLLSVEIYKDFVKQFKKHSREFRETVMEFINGFEGNVEKMKPLLGDAFKSEDYDKFMLPGGGVNVEFLKEQFSLEVEYGTVSDADDIRANLTEADREVIAAHITEKNNEKFAKSQEHIITMLHDHIMAIHERLSQEENIFRDTLISNLEDLCDLIPKMNIAGDPVLNQLAADAKAKLCQWDPAAIRETPTIRNNVAKEADKMLDSMKGII
jgi:hypothetical protein